MDWKPVRRGTLHFTLSSVGRAPDTQITQSGYVHSKIFEL